MFEATTAILRCTVSCHGRAPRSAFTEGNMHRARLGAESWFKERKAAPALQEERGEECPEGRCLLSLRGEKGGRSAGSLLRRKRPDLNEGVVRCSDLPSSPALSRDNELARANDVGCNVEESQHCCAPYPSANLNCKSPNNQTNLV